MKSRFTITAKEWLRLHGCDTLEEYEALPRYPYKQFCARCDRLKESIEAECKHCEAKGKE